MSVRDGRRPRLAAHVGPWMTVVAAAVGLMSFDGRLALAAADEPALARFVPEGDPDSPLGWLARAEQLVGQWGAEFQRGAALGDLATVLADAGQIDAAEAIARRLERATGVFAARKALVAAYARAGKLEEAEATARLSVEPDGRAEPGAYCEFECQIACSLADVGRSDEAERVLARLDAPPADWPIAWEPPASLPAIRARIHAALAVACFKAGRRDAYQRHAAEAERIAAAIPGDVNEMWTEMLSSSRPPGQDEKPHVDPMNAIYKSQAATAAVVARGEAGDFEAARKALEIIPAGRHRDVILRRLIDAALHADALAEARRLADTIETDDHRGLAYLTLVPAYLKANNRAEATALAERIEHPESRLLAQLHLASGVGGSGESGNLMGLMAPAVAGAGEAAAEREARLRLQLGGGAVPVPPTTPRLRAEKCREAAHLLARACSRDELLAWIESLPDPDARFYALLGVGESRLQASDAR